VPNPTDSSRNHRLPRLEILSALSRPRLAKTPRPAKTPEPQMPMKAHSDSRHPYLRIPDVIAINVIAVIAAIAAVVAMTESYTNLLDFAENFGLHGWRADIAPAAIDSFIVMGELLLFTAMIRGWTSGRSSTAGRWPSAGSSSR